MYFSDQEKHQENYNRAPRSDRWQHLSRMQPVVFSCQGIFAVLTNTYLTSAISIDFPYDGAKF